MWNAIRENKRTVSSESEEDAIRTFNEHNERVKAMVPAERLLVWRAEEGWEPICKALNLPVPDEPFPKVNKRNIFWSLKIRMFIWMEGIFNNFLRIPTAFKSGNR